MRRLTVISAVLLGMTYFLPIWQLDIQAPQYPEGLGLTIWLSHMTGNLTQINLLNHYIGMKHITPSAIPELAFMPEVVLVLAALGVMAGLANRRWLIGCWIALVSVAGALGLYDFYRWGYDYGHHLDPHAAIQVPGMTYQPPLIGHKQLLNIDAYSYPSLGGILIAVALGLAFFALLRSRPAKAGVIKPLALVLGLGLGITSLSACNTPPQPIRPGVDHCEHCEMTITDNRYGGEIITAKGRVFKFDSLACLVRFYVPVESQVRSVLVSDFLSPGKLVNAQQAKFVHSDRISAPMGPGVVATADEGELQKLRARISGEVLDWKSVLKLLHSS